MKTLHIRSAVWLLAALLLAAASTVVRAGDPPAPAPPGGESAAPAATSTAPELTEDSFEKWRDFIRPKVEELEWVKIGWRATFWDGVVEAQRDEKPILLWAMNGHPLACT